MILMCETFTEYDRWIEQQRKQKMKFVNPMDRIEELETALEKAADRIEALETALRRIRDDGKNCIDHCRRQADKALRTSAALDKDTGRERLGEIDDDR